MPHARILSKQAVELDVWTLAKDRIRHAYETYDHVAVSLSGGKDSTVVLNATIEVARELDRLPVRTLFFDEEAIPSQTDEYLHRIADRPEVALEWYCPPMKYVNACSSEDPWWYPWAPEERDQWVRPMPQHPSVITELPGYDGARREDRTYHYHMLRHLFFPEQHGRALVMLGIRAAESMMRTRMTLLRYADSWINPHTEEVNGILDKGYPIYDWRTPDVWTAISRFGWDYNKAYDRMAMVGIPPHYQRISSPFHVEAVRSLKIVQECYPEVADRYLARVPGALTAARYGTGELYGRETLPEKPIGIRWRDFVVRAIKAHPPERQAYLGPRIAREIRSHFRKTADPILERTPHPYTGMCWRWLLKLAIQDDLMERKQPQRLGDAPQRAKQKEARTRQWHAELREFKETGRMEDIQP